jgi:hypothetical protein
VNCPDRKTTISTYTYDEETNTKINTTEEVFAPCDTNCLFYSKRFIKTGYAEHSHWLISCLKHGIKTRKSE